MTNELKTTEAIDIVDNNISSGIIADATKARIQAQFMVAINRPRSYEQSRYRILEACKRPVYAERVEYTKPTGGKPITGPSIRFAEMALREWGNIDYTNYVLTDDEDVRRVMVVVTDLETNTSFSTSIQFDKTVERSSSANREVVSERINSRGYITYIVKATEEEVLTKQSSLISKALRNEGLRLIPQEIIEEAMEVAKEAKKKGVSQNITIARQRIADAFLSIGVQPKQLERYLKHPVSLCSEEEILELRNIYEAIKTGEAKWNEFSQEITEEKAFPSVKAKLEALKTKMAEKQAEK